MACSTGRINGLFRKAHRWQLASRVCTVEQLAGTADAGLFKAITSNSNISLYQILPPIETKSVFIAQTWTSFSASHNKHHPFKINFHQQVPLSVCVIPSIPPSLPRHLACVDRPGPLLCRCDAAGKLAASSFILHTLCCYYSVFLLVTLY